MEEVAWHFKIADIFCLFIQNPIYFEKAIHRQNNVRHLIRALE